MPLPTIQIKDAIEVIESRISGGRHLTKLVLSLAILSGVVLMVRYLYEALLQPISKFFGFVLSGGMTPASIKATFLSLGVASAITAIVAGVLQYLVSVQVQKRYERTSALADRAANVADKLLDHMDKINPDFFIIGERLAIIEKKLGLPTPCVAIEPDSKPDQPALPPSQV